MSKTRRKEPTIKRPIKHTIECAACGNIIKNVHAIVCLQCEKESEDKNK